MLKNVSSLFDKKLWEFSITEVDNVPEVRVGIGTASLMTFLLFSSLIWVMVEIFTKA